MQIIKQSMVWVFVVCFIMVNSIQPSNSISLTPSPTMTRVPTITPVSPPLVAPPYTPPLGTTLSPTQTVTIAPTRTPKDIGVCENATTLSPGQTINGTTIHPAQHSSGIFSSGGLWYKVIGTGGPLKVDTCNFANFPTTIDVLVGETCGSLKFFYTGSIGKCGEFGSSQDWFTTKGTTYYVRVTGILKKGSFEVKLTEQIAPSNDLCINASPIVSGQTITANTTDASLDNVPPCGTDTLYTSSRGVWYRFQSSSQPSRIVANTCLSGKVDTAISVFTGTCDKLMCVAGNDNYCNYYASRVEWESQTATDYLILVHGGNLNNVNFVLQVEEVPATPTVSPAPSLISRIPIPAPVAPPFPVPVGPPSLPLYSLSPGHPAVTTTASSGAPSSSTKMETAAPFTATVTATGNPTPFQELSIQPIRPANYVSPPQTGASYSYGKKGKGYRSKKTAAREKKGEKKDEKKGSKE